MKNKIIVNQPKIDKNRIECSYCVEGEWSEAFTDKRSFFVEYSCDISEVTASLAVVPLLANILPVSWLYDAQIIVPVCDKAFFESIDDFKRSYIEMYPMLEFKGSLTVEDIQENHSMQHGKVAAFFSGGVDAFDTLIRHVAEKPVLLTIWGMGIGLEDTLGWDTVLKLLEKVKEAFSVDYITIKSNFRELLNVPMLDEIVSEAKDLWVHGFQYGIGIISHAAPIALEYSISTVYIASSGFESENPATCSSDPSIDNFVRFCNANVIHDGFEFDRQQKIHNITDYSKRNKANIKLMVCIGRNNERGMLNCCTCTKCKKTMFGIYAEGEDPRNYGFSYTDNDLQKIVLQRKFEANGNIKRERFLVPIWNAMHNNLIYKNVPDALKWFYDMEPDELVNINISRSLLEPIRKNGYEHKVLVWSACVKTDAIVEELKENNIEIFGYIDRKSSALDYYKGHKVFDKSILKTDRFFVYVGMDTTYRDVIDYLTENNYVEFEDYIYPNS